MNPLFANIPTTVFEVMSGLARDTGAINLGQGFPDDPGPGGCPAEGRRGGPHGNNQYPSMMGLPELRSAIAAHYGHWQGLDLDPATEVMVTSGATEALAGAILALIEPGDEVVLFEPMYDAYLPLVRLAGGIPALRHAAAAAFPSHRGGARAGVFAKDQGGRLQQSAQSHGDDLLGRRSRAAGGFLPSLRRHRDLGRGLGARGVRRPPPSAGSRPRGHARAQRQDRFRRQDLQPHGLEGRVRVRGTPHHEGAGEVAPVPHLHHAAEPAERGGVWARQIGRLFRHHAARFRAQPRPVHRWARDPGLRGDSRAREPISSTSTSPPWERPTTWRSAAGW